MPVDDKIKPSELLEAQFKPFANLVAVRELQFAKKAMGRKWAFDVCFPDFMVAVELEGLVPRRLWDPKKHQEVLVLYGRHVTVPGFQEDMEKYNCAALLGWTVLRFPVKHVKSRKAYETILMVLAARGWRAA